MNNMPPVDQIIKSLNDSKQEWRQDNCTLTHIETNVQIWTENIPYLNCYIYSPKIKLGFIDKIRLQLAVNRWYKSVDLGLQEAKS